MSRRGAPKVRITDHRPAASRGLGGTHVIRHGSAPAMTGLDYLSESQKREAAEHDQNVASYSVAMLPAVYDDVCRRIERFPKVGLSKAEASELRWLRSRKGALLRLGSSMRERGLA